MTTQEVYEQLRAAGIEQDSESWDDYTEAKHLLLRVWVSEAEYKVISKAIVDYLHL
jgi:hypothetical protein